MTRKDIEEIKKSEEWVKIIFHSSTTHGTMIIKGLLFDRKQKQFQRLFKGIEVDVMREYIPDWRDVFESAIREYKSILTSIRWHKNYLGRRYDPNELYVEEYEKILQQEKDCLKRIERLERKLK